MHTDGKPLLTVVFANRQIILCKNLTPDGSVLALKIPTEDAISVSMVLLSLARILHRKYFKILFVRN